VRYFHGGVPDLRVGDLLTPHEPNYAENCQRYVQLTSGQCRSLLRRWTDADLAVLASGGEQ
jgi:hypothetical protein